MQCSSFTVMLKKVSLLPMFFILCVFSWWLMTQSNSTLYPTFHHQNNVWMFQRFINQVYVRVPWNKNQGQLNLFLVVLMLIIILFSCCQYFILSKYNFGITSNIQTITTSNKLVTSTSWSIGDLSSEFETTPETTFNSHF